MTTHQPTDQPTDQPTHQPPPPTGDMTSPYRGLTPYTEADAAYFFGRTAEIATITANLEVTRLTLFYGPSGVGKSSVLRAGVVHGLTRRAQANFSREEAAEQIPVYFSSWASDPMLGLSQTLAEAVRPYLVEAHAAAPPAPTRSLLDQLQYWSKRTQSELLLVLDQFEEFFQYHIQLAGGQQNQVWDPNGFGAQLMQVVNHSTLPVNVLISLREDALARLDYFQGRIPALLDNRLSIGHLTRRAGQEAVVQPLGQFNHIHNTAYTLEDDLVTAVLDQVGSGQVALSRQGAGGRSDADGRQPAGERIEAPYLQLVMTRLWEQELQNGSAILRLTTLNDQLGGAGAIVRNYLDDTLEALEPAERTLVASFFDRLVTPSGAKIALTLTELAHYAQRQSQMIAPVLQQLQDRRLLRAVQAPNGLTQYEIFHDVLGPALLDWQERYQKAQAEAQRLAAAQAERVEAERRAHEAEERARLQEEARREAQARAEAEAERAEAEAERAEAETRRVRQARWALAVVSLLLLVAAGLLVWAFGERAAANAARAQADANAAAAQAAEATAQAESTRAIAGEQTAEANRVAAETQAELARLAQATAVANERMAAEQKVIADERAQEAALQAQIAGSRQLAAQSASALAASNMELALLLYCG